MPLLQIGVNVVNTILSLTLTAFAALFVMWINGKQQDFDQLQDKSN
jgi:hypothetical protein